jgi:hypothetical protein
MNKKSYSGIALLCLAVSVMVAVTAGLGVFARGDGSAAEVASVRGERYLMATTGVYAHNAQRVVAEGVGWDLVTLFLVVPAMLLVLPTVRRGSLRGRLAAMGLLGYFVYQYLMYVMTWAFGPLFLPFTVIFSAAAAALAWIASTIRISDLPERFTDRFPRRGVAIFCWLMSAALTALWLQRIVAGLRADWAKAMLQGETTLVVQAMDLGILVPLAVFTGVAAWRRKPVGYLLAPVFMIKGLTMCAAIVAMVIGAAVVEHKLDAGGLAMFAAALLASTWIALRVYGSLKSD